MVVYKWRITWNASGFASSNGHVNGNARATVNISLFGNLFDNTTGLWLLGGVSAANSAVQVFYETVGTSVTFSNGGVGQNFSVTFSVHLTSGDTYLFYTGLTTVATSFASTGCAVFGCANGRSVASINVNSGGDYARILSMSVS